MAIVSQRRFGRTGLQIPEVTYGGGWVGGLLITAEQSTAFAMLDRAMETGVDWLDTAAAYGDGASERVIGRWLGSLGTRPKPRISTKFNIDATGGDFRGQVRQSLEASLERLGLSHVELLILHNRIVADNASERGARDLLPSEILSSGGIADIMDDLRAEGLIKHPGMTGLGDPMALSQVVDSGRFDVVQIYYNALNPSSFDDVPQSWNSTDFSGLGRRCVAQDMGVMGIRIFAAGHLATDQRHGREIPISENAEDGAEEARVKVFNGAIADVLGQSTRAQAALRFGLANQSLSTVVVGIGEPEHFEQVLQAAKLGALGSQDLAKIRAIWQSKPAFVS